MKAAFEAYGEYFRPNTTYRVTAAIYNSSDPLADNKPFAELVDTVEQIEVPD
jgi:hypothetical protein